MPSPAFFTRHGLPAPTLFDRVAALISAHERRVASRARAPRTR
ncbi:MAG TPA: hypothetical protein VF576_06480 [Rubricoccaceae bacterium]|jgi:hypothetical protein